MTELILLRDLFPVMREVLDSGGEFTFRPSGSSMLPMLDPKNSSVTVRKPEGRLKKYDLPLYMGDDGHFVLHRVVKVLPDGYVMLGDRNIRREEGIGDDRIVGVVSAFTRGGRRHSVDEPGYRLYCRVWTALPLLRRLMRLLERKN